MQGLGSKIHLNSPLAPQPVPLKLDSMPASKGPFSANIHRMIPKLSVPIPEGICYLALSSQSIFTWFTTQRDPRCVHFSGVCRILGKAWLRAVLILLFCRITFSLWRSRGSVYSSLPSRLSFRSATLRASWNFTPLRALSSSMSLSWIWIWGSTSLRKALWSACPLGTYICHSLKNLPMTHGVIRCN